MKNVLVFGGYGFLGYYLVKELLHRGYSVTIADINSTEEFGDTINFIKCDISDKQQVEKVFSSDKFDIIYNLAGFANLDNAIDSPLQTLNLNVIGNIHILEECAKHSITNFIYASSTYAMSSKGSFYGISKLASEKIIEEYHKKYKLPFIILRYGSVYSERAYDNNYIYNLVKKAVLDKVIEHEGDGNEIREYIHAADAAKLSVDVIESDDYNNLHVILTGIEKMKRVELFNMINEILNGSLKISLNDQADHNHYQYTPYSFEPSISKKLIANPHIDMGQGLLDCIRSVHNENY